jgi:putative membrane protein
MRLLTQVLSESDRVRLDQHVANAERRTGAQIVLAVIDRCDVYAELPWKVFALGAAFGGLGASAADRIRPGWPADFNVLAALALALGVGAVGALLSVFAPGFARLFLDRHRAETEVRQYAESLFLSRELFATRGRTGILLLVGLFERQVFVRPDVGLKDRLSQEVLGELVAEMTARLARGRAVEALEEGVNRLEGALAGTAPVSAGENELPNGVVREVGP